MFGDQGREQKILQMEQRIREIEILLEGQNREINASFESWDLSPQKIRKYLENPDYFSARNWEQLELCRREEEDKLQRLMRPSIDPKATRQTRKQSARAQGHWIPLQ